MKADREAFIEQTRLLGREALLELAVSLYDELEDVRLKQLENDRVRTEAHIQYSELSRKYAAAIAENADLKALLQKEIEKQPEDKIHFWKENRRLSLHSRCC